jgi:hypothetical protein
MFTNKMLPNLLLRNNKPKKSYVKDMSSKYAIWNPSGGYFAGTWGGDADFRSDPMMATKYNTEHEAEEAALNELGMDPQEFEIRQVR